MQDLSVTVNANNTAVVVSGSDIQKVIGYAEIVRRYDVKCAMVTVHCVVGRRLRSRTNDVGLFQLLQQAGATLGTSGDVVSSGGFAGTGSFSDFVSSLAVDLSTGIATVGGVWTAREALEVITQFVSADSRFRVMSHPNITVISGRSGTFSSGREIPVPNTAMTAVGSTTSVEYKKAEFVFTVTPTVLEDGTVRMDIEQGNSDVLDTQVVAGSQVPILSTQKMQTVVDIRGQQLFYLGGIEISTDQTSNTGTPYFRKIPLVNWVLGRDSTRHETDELFVVLTAEVRRNGDAPVMVRRAIPVGKGVKHARSR